MILDAAQFRKLVNEVTIAISADSTGVGEVEVVESLAGINSLPALKIAYGRETVVEAPLSLLSKRADDAAEEAQVAIIAANAASIVASAAADRADAERVGLEEIKHLTLLATSESLTQTNVTKDETRLTGETRLATLSTLTDLQRKLVDVVIVIADAHTGVEELAEYQKRSDEAFVIVARSAEELLTISGGLKELRAQVADVTRQAFVAITACNLSTDDARLFASLARQELAHVAEQAEQASSHAIGSATGADAAAAHATEQAGIAGIATTATDISRQNIEKNEASRNTSETGRISAEELRVSAEKRRVLSEGERISEEKKRISSEIIRTNAEQGRITSETERELAEAERVNTSIDAVGNANGAAIRLNALSDHRDEIRDGYWWRWNEETREYENTGKLAKGNIMFASFDISPVTGELSCTTDEEYAGASFSIESGDLVVTI